MLIPKYRSNIWKLIGTMNRNCSFSSASSIRFNIISIMNSQLFENFEMNMQLPINDASSIERLQNVCSVVNLMELHKKWLRAMSCIMSRNNDTNIQKHHKKIKLGNGAGNCSGLSLHSAPNYFDWFTWANSTLKIVFAFEYVRLCYRALGMYSLLFSNGILLPNKNDIRSK